jgi:predicted membrane chloride channel (bestrophin family)
MRTLISVLLAFIATFISYRYNLIFNLDLTLISVAVVFPLVFTLGSAFQRREKALEHLGRAKGALSAIKYCFSFANKVEESEKEKVYLEVDQVKEELIALLYAKSNSKEKLNLSVSKIQEFIDLHRETIGRSLSLRVYRLMRDVIMGIENSFAIKAHRTPHSIRAYCKLFIYVFPFFYAPTLIKNVQFQDVSVQELADIGTIVSLDNHLVWIVYGLNMIISFFLITLFNIQEQIENPFDQEGLDDIILDNYLLDK